MVTVAASMRNKRFALRENDCLTEPAIAAIATF